jgi:hypothetical protein
MPRSTKKQKPASDHVKPAAILDAQAVDEIKDALRACAAMASTLTEAGIFSSDELILIGLTTESACDAALSRLERAIAAAKTKRKTPSKSTTEVLS